MKKTILIIDDNARLCDTLTQAFKQEGYIAVCAADGQEALRLAAREQLHVVLLDIMLDEEDGLAVLKHLLTLRPNLPVIMITGYSSVETAVQSLKLGAFDYIKKPLDFGHVLKIVENAANLSRLNEENQQLTDHLLELAPRIVTQNSAMLALCEKARKFAATDLPVLITG